MEKEVSFEQKIENARKILQKLVDPQITLAQSVKAYEEGIKELNEATKMLEEAKLKINEIKNNS
jgi:exodeoxyribonuclease VII small subunit